jgi:hypothetical protein
MKFSFHSVYLLAVLLSTSPTWELKTNTGIDIYGTGPQACKSLYIPRGAKIDWTGIKGGHILEVFTVYQQGKCSGSTRTVAGEGEINASNNIYGYVVKA